MRLPSTLRYIAHSVSLLSLSGCEGVQSALAPTGSAADQILDLSVVLFVGGALIFLFVMALLLYAMLSGQRQVGGTRWIIGGGLIFPVVALSALLVYGLPIGRTLTAPPPADALRIEVIGHMWWWEVRYPDFGPEGSTVLANEIHVPVGRPVEFIVTTSDVIHSFWVPKLAGKIDMIPNHVNRLVVEAKEAGVFRGECAEYCGAQHALMAFYVVAEPPETFEAWLTNQSRPAAEPLVPFLQHGREVFLAAGCGSCHSIRGTSANGVLGPDLTHVGSRLSIAAGVLDNHIGTLAGWIADSQNIKPENRMPSFNQLTGEELRAVATYLESLK